MPDDVGIVVGILTENRMIDVIESETISFSSLLLFA
jgi:hypothetical protein